MTPKLGNGRTGPPAECPQWVESGRSLRQAEAMGPVKKITVTLRFRGDDLDPRELTKRLGSPRPPQLPKAEHGLPPPVRKGFQKRDGGACNWKQAMRTPSTIRLPNSSPLSADCATWRDLSERYGGNLFVGVFLGSSNEGLTVAPETASAIGQRGLSLQLDIYERDAD